MAGRSRKSRSAGSSLSNTCSACRRLASQPVMRNRSRGHVIWDLREVLARPEFAGINSPIAPARLTVQQDPRALTAGGDAETNRLQPLATPLMSVGVSG